jgi:lysophospholipase L1-like esterase
LSASVPQLGVLAFGDSITNGGGELQWGVPLQSWALWMARGLGLPYSGYAVDGNLVDDVLDRQILAHSTRTPVGARYDLGCLYIGVNDVRGLDWDAERFAAGYRAALAYLAERCERVLAVTVPLDLGRPRAGAKVLECNTAIEREARAAGALILDLRAFGARNLVMVDHVHPTAFGQIAIAERALAVLRDDGLPTRAEPRAMIVFETTWIGRLRGDASYVYRRTKLGARNAWLRAVWAIRPPA